MRLVSRFILPLVAALALLAVIASLFGEKYLTKWFTSDLERRGKLIESLLTREIVEASETGVYTTLQQVFDVVTRDERLFAIGLCSTGGNLIAASSEFEKALKCPSEEDILLRKAASVDGRKLYLTFLRPIEPKDSILVFAHEMGFVSRRAWHSKLAIFGFFFVLTFVVSLITIVIAKLSFSKWIDQVRSVIRYRGNATDPRTVTPELLPVLRDFREVLDELESERFSSDPSRELWSPTRLRETLSSRLEGDQVLIVANREPYIHEKKGGKIQVKFPASGVVSALEPIMRACSGVWIAHGSGSADREVVDEHDRVWVPPGENAYQIRRVWLSNEEEQGYYYGFANEGIWPLCHIAHIRPVFRRSDWEYYSNVNRKFADAVIQEARRDDPIILVQDYHFALLPALIRERLPRATIITFWHVPWPNAEKFSICPWQSEILQGLLGSTVIGFHTRYHVNNFLETVDRTLECRIDREHFGVVHRGNLTEVRSYPISIEFPPRFISQGESVAACRKRILAKHSLPEDALLAIGVERLDYTKGILERFWSIERLLETYPDFLGQFKFIQIVAPSRTSIESYKNFAKEVRDLTKKINERFAPHAPILLLEEHHDPADVVQYYRAADICTVTSLHDGMNLVAKEFIASRDDERGVLILSVFAGAAKELPEALLVNPYDIEQCAEAFRRAATMAEDEKIKRMRSMREQVKQWNVYRWAARMMVNAADVREKNRVQEALSTLEANSPLTRF